MRKMQIMEREGTQDALEVARMDVTKRVRLLFSAIHFRPLSDSNMIDKFTHPFFHI
jgi:hypothetical protein